jgi:hypothetical protein
LKEGRNETASKKMVADMPHLQIVHSSRLLIRSRGQMRGKDKKMENYQRPEVTKDEAERAKQEMLKLFRKSGPEFRGLVMLLIAENMRLVRECNDHRAKLGYKPLEVH